MADYNTKNAKNASGKYYVDTNCIGCGQCVDAAPQFFKQDENSSMYVYTQPSSNEDIALCDQALNSCPVDAIGKTE